MRARWSLAILITALACLTTVAGSADDAAIEDFLLRAKVVSSKEIGSGITKPMKMELELDGETMAAAFKYVKLDYSQRKVRVGDDVMLIFTDDYHYERAAYLLDRYLGMDMIPVAVLRKVDGDEGALIQWVSDAINEMDRRNAEINPPDLAVLARQRDIMKIFDYLVRNSDRNLANQLINTDDWKLHLIDHSRCFRLDKKLPKSIEQEPLALPRWLYERLRQMDLAELQPLLRGLVSKSRIKAMLSRRDELIEKIDRDRAQYGDELVFHEEMAQQQQQAAAGAE